jgi:hypothetical protein
VPGKVSGENLAEDLDQPDVPHLLEHPADHLSGHDRRNG